MTTDVTTTYSCNGSLMLLRFNWSDFYNIQDQELLYPMQTQGKLELTIKINEFPENENVENG
ncbi:hypothetical protein [Microcoleus sp. FACHB-SPT15]|uniref:hypothetical protein n=1 Tax=Microcoleus sp. FACHB-SPT15 TaxID=2692830 RepID=UPI0018EF9BF4|nr:hypothetical protein [Microcoleus sp. FACHB-SPT15]